jgi:hypothetical protein
VADRLIWTVGHSTQERDQLVALLRPHGVERIADVRRYPASRRHPQFNAAEVTGFAVVENEGALIYPAPQGRLV